MLEVEYTLFSLDEDAITEKYKTELCNNWQLNGNCPYSYKCRFAHGFEELNIRNPLNNRYKTKFCQKFFY